INAILDTDGSGALTARRLYTGGVDQLAGRVSAGSAGWYLTDRQGGIRDVTHSTGSGGEGKNYDALGAPTTGPTPPAGDRYGYTPREYDPLTGIQYNRGRELLPAGGVWMEKDPKGFGAGDPNLYRDVGNDPTNATDPSGLEPDQEEPTPPP